jgi:hypothetical protein
MALGLLADRLAQPELTATRIARESDGVPLFVSELVAYFLKDLTGDETGLSMSILLAQRLRALAASERRALDLLSLAARPVSEQLLGRAMSDEPSCLRMQSRRR